MSPPISHEESQAIIAGVQTQKIVRCPTCNRRLHPRALYSWDGYSFLGFVLPKHKMKVLSEDRILKV